MQVSSAYAVHLIASSAFQLIPSADVCYVPAEEVSVEGGVEDTLHLSRGSVSGRTFVFAVGSSDTRHRLDLALGDSPPLCAVRFRTTHWERGSPKAAFPVVVVYRFNTTFHDFPMS